MCVLTDFLCKASDETFPCIHSMRAASLSIYMFSFDGVSSESTNICAALGSVQQN